MRNFFFLVIYALLVSCGESPLLNHEMEKTILDNDYFQTREEGFKFSHTKFSFSLDWTTGPLKGESQFILKSWNDKLGSLNGPYQDLPENLHIYLWMPDMGHGSSPVKIKRIAPGEYEVSSVYFIMGGKWQIFFQLTKEGKVIDEVSIPLTL